MDHVRVFVYLSCFSSGCMVWLFKGCNCGNLTRPPLPQLSDVLGVCKSYYYSIPYNQFELFQELDELSAKDYDNFVRGDPVLAFSE